MNINNTFYQIKIKSFLDFSTLSFNKYKKHYIYFPIIELNTCQYSWQKIPYHSQR